MKEEKPPEDVQHYTAAPFIDPKIEKPPVGVRIGEDLVCRDCMTASEEITMRRGIIDFISAIESEGKGYICTRCSKKISSGS